MHAKPAAGHKAKVTSCQKSNGNISQRVLPPISLPLAEFCLRSLTHCGPLVCHARCFENWAMWAWIWRTSCQRWLGSRDAPVVQLAAPPLVEEVDWVAPSPVRLAFLRALPDFFLCLKVSPLAPTATGWPASRLPPHRCFAGRFPDSLPCSSPRGCPPNLEECLPRKVRHCTAPRPPPCWQV